MMTMGAHVCESTHILHTYTLHSVLPKKGYWNHGTVMSSSLWALSEANEYLLPKSCSPQPPQEPVWPWARPLGSLLSQEGQSVPTVTHALEPPEQRRRQRGFPLICHLHSGWLHGERLRDGETGWFPESFARSITSRVAVEGNVRRMERLRVETDV